MEGAPVGGGGVTALAGGKVPLAARLRQQRVALGCHKRRAPLGGCPFVAGAVLPGLTAGVGVVQVARAVAELGEVVWAALLAGVQRAGRHAGGLGPCRRRSPSCLHGADSPSCGLWASGHLGMKNPPENAVEGITRAVSSGCILVGAASVSRARYLVSIDMPGAHGLPARILVHTRPVPP